MRRTGIVGFLTLLLWTGGAYAQTSPNPQQIADTMVRLCVGGGHTEALTGGGTGGLDFSLRSLDAKGNVSGEYKMSKSSAEGLVNGLDNALGQVAADQADKVRDCLKPVRDRLLEILLPPPPKSGDIIRGHLLPAQYDSPPSPCGYNLKPGNAVLYYGSNAAIALTFPHTVMRIEGRDVVSLNRNPDGQVTINLEILGKDGRAIVVIKDNVFTVNTNNFYSMEWPDKSSLIVTDRQREKVLDITYLNESAIKILGTIHYAGITVEIGPEITNIGGMKVSHSCFSANNADIVLN